MQILPCKWAYVNESASIAGEDKKKKYTVEIYINIYFDMTGMEDCTHFSGQRMRNRLSYTILSNNLRKYY